MSRNFYQPSTGDKFFSMLAKFGVWLFLATLAALAFGSVIARVWDWYIVPALGVPSIKYKTGIGMGYLVTMLADKPKVTGLPLWANPIVTVVYSLITLAFAGFWLWALP